MAQTINTNVASLNAQRNLGTSQSALATSLQRLSSGLRINSAKDDAAGLAISDRMSAQIRGLNQAVRNANDGISLSQTGEGALNEVSNNLQRIRELAIQSTNGTNTAADRQALDAEVQQRLAEIDRISAQTSFNGQKILDGSLGTAAFQVGANVGESISVNLTTSTRTSATGAIASATTTSLTTAAVADTPATSGRITINPSTFNFGVGATPQVDGKNSMAGATGGVYDFSAAAAVVGNNVQTNTRTDFSLTNLTQFNVVQGANTATITLSTNLTNAAGVASEIQTQLQATTGFATATVAATATGFKISGVGALAVAVGALDGNATGNGMVASAGNAGGANQNATFTIDGTAVTVNTAVTTPATLVTAINAAITTAGAPLTGYTAAIDGAGVKITHTGSTTAVAITAANASAVNNGLVNGTGTGGTAAVSSTNATFTADGQAVSLTTSYASFNALATDIAAQMNTAVAGTYTVTNTAGALEIKKVATGLASTAVNITAAGGFASNAGIAVASGTAGAALVVGSNGGIAQGASFTLATGDLTLAAGSNAVVDLAGSYTTLQSLVDAVNSKVSGVNASTSGGTLSLSSAQAISAAGTKATVATNAGGFGLSATTAATVSASNSLLTANVLTSAAANTAVQRIDSALEVVNGLRGTFGAVQNRFESVIGNLQTASENLVSAQSRIRDTDFASETAALTRNQILQQAGIAMLAQANALPNQVLTLLRG